MWGEELEQLERLDTSLDRQCIRDCTHCIFATLLECQKFINLHINTYDWTEEEEDDDEANIDNFYNWD